MTEEKPPPFLCLPETVRKRILAYLLCPDPREDFTTINYDLEWPNLQNPSSMTFTTFKLDMCRCSKRVTDEPDKEHIYQRYVCEGPHVRVKGKNSALWVLEIPLATVNILRPATQQELSRRPHFEIARVCKFLYQDSIPLLYRGRRIRFLAAHGPRGRYQAYATQTVLSRMSSFAREQITFLSLICQDYEEDCRWNDTRQSYQSFCDFVLISLPRCRTLHLLVRPLAPKDVVQAFTALFRRQNMRILVSNMVGQEDVQCLNEEQFLSACEPLRDT
jgi:hypothetical protein